MKWLVLMPSALMRRQVDYLVCIMIYYVSLIIVVYVDISTTDASFVLVAYLDYISTAGSKNLGIKNLKKNSNKIFGLK